ncbi:ribonuclease [Aeromonas caviae]|nr:ribonuclease [Aeromonas sp. WP2-W18-CRE-05]BDA12343.1 ribonuclease [Aeromonas caviae]BDN93765.1 ribonuclease [Aeromonas caviae]GKR72151.1 ribonuclease [Aeromonas caviae]
MGRHRVQRDEGEREMKQVMVWLVGSLLWISAAQGKGYAGEFDYYAMALSWSPEHCAIKPGDREQCARKLGFVLHGLWPQYQRGYPASCTRERLDADMEQQFAGLYPSRFLYRHEWEKHGTCSGLSQEAFHQLASDLRQKVKIPAAYQSPEEPLRKNSFQLKADLASANEWLAPDNITVACADGGRFLREIYICINQQGTDAVPCSDEMQKRERRSCGQPDFLLRSVR